LRTHEVDSLKRKLSDLAITLQQHLRATLAVMWVLFSGSQNALAASLEDGVAAARRGDYASALPIYATLAEAGDTRAMVHLGSLYQKGEGVTRDLKRAVSYYTKAAAGGNADAQFSLGNLYLLGEGVPQDDDWAFTYYRQAAAQGHVLASKNVNEFYRAAGVAPPAVTTASRPVSAPTNAPPVAPAQSTPATDSPIGIIPAAVSEDELRAIEFAQAHGIVIEQVPGVVENTPAAPALSSSALGEIKQRLAAGETALARNDLEILADAGDVEAQFLLSRLLLTLQADASAKGEALLWLKRAASGSFAEAQYALAETYRRGTDLPRDEAEAVTWYRAAARQGHSGAQQQLNAIYQDAGIPLPSPYANAAPGPSSPHE
jgi:uncharacterized protein